MATPGQYGEQIKIVAAILSPSGGRTVALDALCVAASVCFALVFAILHSRARQWPSLRKVSGSSFILRSRVAIGERRW